WHGSKAGETIGMCLDGRRQQIINLPRERDRRCRIEGLTTRLIVREHLQFDPGGIHSGETCVAEIEQLGHNVEAEKLLAVAAALGPRGKVLLLPWRDEVLLERDDPHLEIL